MISFDANTRALADIVGKGDQLLIAQMWRDLAAKPAFPQSLFAAKRTLPQTLDQAGFRAFSQFDEDGILLYIFALIGTTNRRAIEMAAGVGYESNTANLIVNHNFTGLLFEGNPDAAWLCEQFYAKYQDTHWNTPVVVDRTWLKCENINEVISKHGFAGEIDLFSLDVDGMDYWLLESLSAVQPRVIVVEYNGIFTADVAMTAAYEPNYSYQEGRASGATLAAFDKLCDRKGYRLVGCNRNCLNAFYVRKDLAPDLFPAVKVQDCLLSARYPWWQEKGSSYKAWMERNAHFPNWQTV